MSARLDALYPELVCQILSSCDNLKQVVDLASTCTRFNTIWTTNASTILTAVAPRCIPAFDDALVASRVTTLVKNSILEAKLPPKSHEINIHAFTAKASRPKIVDMGPVMGFHYVVNVTEKAYLDGTALRVRRWNLPTNDAWYPRPPRHLPPDNHWSQTARVSFHRALYRVRLAGSVITGWHLEPFTLDVASTISFRGEPANMRLLGLDYEYDMSKKDPRLGFLPQRQDYVDLRRYPAFDQGPKTTLSSTQDTIYHSLSDWLIASMTEHVADTQGSTEHIAATLESWDFGSPGSLGNDGTSPGVFAAILREVMRMLVAYEHLAQSIINFDGRRRNGRVSHDPVRHKFDLRNIPEGKGKIFAFVMGVYQLEELRVVGDTNHTMVACPTPPLSSVDVFTLQDIMHRYTATVSGTSFFGVRGPPPNLQLFVFILNRYFGMRMNFRSFNGGFSYYVENVLLDGTIFTNHGTSSPDWLKELGPYHEIPASRHVFYYTGDREM